MATWVNLLDVIYPAGSIYLSRSSTSPASTIGGSWTQIKGAVLAACGANSFATNNYGGSLKISVNQMPQHTHGARMAWGDSNGNVLIGFPNPSSNYTLSVDELNSNRTQNYSTGGGKLFALPLWSIHLVQDSVGVYAKLLNGLKQVI